MVCLKVILIFRAHFERRAPDSGLSAEDVQVIVNGGSSSRSPEAVSGDYCPIIADFLLRTMPFYYPNLCSA